MSATRGPSKASIERFLSDGPLEVDIETTGLKADYGLVLVVGFRQYRERGSGRVVQFVLDRTKADWEKAENELLFKASAYLRMSGLRFPDDDCAPKIVTFNGSRFDIPYFQARLAIQGLEMLPKMRHLDMFFTAKRTFGYTITSRRAKYLQSLYSVGDPKAPHKESSEVMTWLRATYSRDKRAFDRIVRHNRTECLQSLDYQIRKLRKVLPRTVGLK